MSKQHNELRFPSGRRKRVVNSRHALARKIVTSTSGDWVKVEAHEESAADSLIAWGMIERHHQTPSYVRWSLLHERPTFGPRLSSFALCGVPVHHLGENQRALLCQVAATGLKGHDVLVKGEKLMQRRFSALARRKLLSIEKREGSVWRLKIADTFPGYRKATPPAAT